jgi:hypothetical protein
MMAACIALVLTMQLIPASQDSQVGSLTDVSGVWVMMIEGHQIGLELDQKGDKVEGIMHAMGQRILLVGTYVDRKLTLKGERPEDQLPHGNSDAGPITALMLENGTLAGELSTNKGRTKWTAERFKKPHLR